MCPDSRETGHINGTDAVAQQKSQCKPKCGDSGPSSYPYQADPKAEHHIRRLEYLRQTSHQATQSAVLGRLRPMLRASTTGTALYETQIANHCGDLHSTIASKESADLHHLYAELIGAVQRGLLFLVRISPLPTLGLHGRRIPPNRLPAISCEHGDDLPQLSKPTTG